MNETQASSANQNSDHHANKLSLNFAAFTILNTMVGAGALVLPSATRNTGIIPSKNIC